MKLFLILILLSFNSYAEHQLFLATSTPEYSVLKQDVQSVKCKTAVSDPVLINAGIDLKKLLNSVCQLMHGKDE